jgi:hypothetical protein
MNTVIDCALVHGGFLFNAFEKIDIVSIEEVKKT